MEDEKPKIKMLAGYVLGENQFLMDGTFSLYLHRKENGKHIFLDIFYKDFNLLCGLVTS